MDEIDKKILCELDLNSRIPISQLSKKLHISRNVATYRIKQLEDKGIVEKYICSLNLGKLGYKIYKIHLKLKNASEKEEKRLFDAIKAYRNVITSIKTQGAFDLSISIACKSISDLDEFLTKLKNEFLEILEDYTISIVVYSKIFKLNKLLLNEKEQLKSERFSTEEAEVQLDESDTKILKYLSQKANAPTIEIAKKAGLSVDIVKYRLKRLSKSIINSFRIFVEFNKIGFFHYIFMLKMRTASKQEEEKLVEWCQEKNNVMYVTKRIGMYDFEVNVAIKDLEDLNNFANDLRREFPSIQSYAFALNTKLLKLDYVPL